MIFEAYFIYTIASTVLISVIAYLIGKAEGHAEGIKKGSRAISNVNKTLDELVLSLTEDRKEDFTTPAVPSGKGSEISELPTTTAVQEHDKFWAESHKDLSAKLDKAIAKKKAKAKTPAAMKPKRKKGKK